MTNNTLVIADALRGELRNLRANVIDQIAEEVKRSRPQVVVSNSTVGTALDEAFDKALSLDIFDVVTRGWQRWHDLQRAVAKSRNDDASYVVPLVEHSIDVVYEPSIELVVNEVTVATIGLTFEVSLTLSGFSVTLKRGALTTIDTGECKSSAKLRLAGQILWSGPLGRIKLPGRWKVDPPLAFYSIAASAA